MVFKFLLNPQNGKTIISLYTKDPIVIITNPPNYPHINFSQPRTSDVTHTNKGTVTCRTFLVREEMYFVTEVCSTLKNKIDIIPKNINKINAGWLG